MVTEGEAISPPEGVGVGIGVGVLVGVGVSVPVGLIVAFLTKQTRDCEPAFPEVSRAVIFMVRVLAVVSGMTQVYVPDFG
jgi:hypothetical protein